jgi:hypothetical protein
LRSSASYVIVAVFLVIPAVFVWRGVTILLDGDIVDGLTLTGFGVAVITAVFALVAYARRNATGGSDVDSAGLIARTVSRWTGRGGGGFGG